MSNKQEIKIAGIGLGAIITAIGLLLIWPIDGNNLLGLFVTLVGLIGFGGFVKGKWY